MKTLIGLFTVLAATIAVTADEPLPEIRFGTPVNMGSEINSASFDMHASMSPNGLELFFMSDRSGVSGVTDLFVATRATVDSPWDSPQKLGAPINNRAIEGAPYLSADGLTMYFTSDRSGGIGNLDIWVSKRDSLDAAWDGPTNLGGVVNSRGADVAPIVTTDQKTIMFSDGAPFLNVPPQREGSLGSEDIWVATRQSLDGPWSEPSNFGEPINSEWGDFAPELSDDGRMLLFTSDRPGGQGEMDLWMSTRSSTDDAWGEPFNLGPEINTPARDFIGRFALDGKSLLYSSLRGDGLGFADIWQAPIYMRCDFNIDDVCDAHDIDLLSIRVREGSDEAVFDVNQDSQVDQGDRRAWVTQLKATWFGDANLDGEFNNLDLIAVLQAGTYAQEVKAGWAEGDWTGDGRFDKDDVLLALQDGGYGQGSLAAVHAVPEPSCALMLLLGIIGTVRLRRAWR